MQPPLAGLTRRNFAREFTAGITLLAIAIPLNIGYAQIAGLPATAGLYALIVPTAIYALVVSSRQLVVSPDAAAAALVASSIGGLAAAGSSTYMTMALAQAIISGVLFLLLAVFKLGFLANFLSKPILVGFVGGLALNIMVSQIAKMLGVKIDSGAEFADKVVQLFGALDTVNPYSLGISVVAVAILLFGKRYLKAVPWALVVMILSTVVVLVFGLEKHGVSVLGEVPAGAPSLTWPVLPWTTWFQLIPSAIALTLVTTAEGLLVSRSYSEKNGYPFDANRDLFAFGLANIAAGAQGSFAAGSSTSRTAAMDQSGSRTQLPSIVLAVGTLLLLVFGTALLADIPNPAIGAIIGVAIIPLLGIREFIDMWRKDRNEFLIGAVCFATTLFVGSIAGILVAFVLALVNLAQRASRPAIDVLADGGEGEASLLEDAPQGTVTAPGVIVIRLAAPLFFANASVFTTATKNAIIAAGVDSVHDLVMDMEAVTDVDITGAEAFENFSQWLEENHVRLSFSRVRPQSAERLKKLGILHDQKIYPTNREAVEAVSSAASASTAVDQKDH
ncbi:SulP family inorganic anion transporter [Microbacterium sp. ASV49]|uniref:SulP family inorganic anion transporter n=1 Tax=Microbacterium candidum TaxID=3041922 RepID=A0ABT7N3M5_9MICO|nr:SulP family inorganic anion transporter [Microbacterium sp. ASV49]MDL9981308.1 SulP family inorganic anion transporter [Microbacterium sp. ASV49]